MLVAFAVGAITIEDRAWVRRDWVPGATADTDSAPVTSEANEDRAAVDEETEYWLSQPHILQTIADAEADFAAGRTVGGKRSVTSSVCRRGRADE